MNAADRGAKHICPDCAVRFYDMKRDEPICPKCGIVVPAPKPKLPRSTRVIRKPNRMGMR